MKKKNKNLLFKKRNKLLSDISKIGPFIEGSITRPNRICGNPNCKCRSNPDKKHPAMYLTWKENKITKSLYIPVAMWEEVELWNKNFKNLKQLIKKMSEVQKEVLRLR